MLAHSYGAPRSPMRSLARSGIANGRYPDGPFATDGPKKVI